MRWPIDLGVEGQRVTHSLSPFAIKGRLASAYVLPCRADIRRAIAGALP